MINQVFKVIKGRKLRAMLTSGLRDLDAKELKSLCLTQLEGMSKRRIKYILAGREMDESSATDDSEEEDDDEQLEQDDQGMASGPLVDDIQTSLLNRKTPDDEAKEDISEQATQALEFTMERPATRAEPKKKKSFVLHNSETEQSDRTVVAESKSGKGRPSRGRRSLTDHYVTTEPKKVEEKSRGNSTCSKVEVLMKKVNVSPEVAKVSPRKSQRSKSINIKEENNVKKTTLNTDKTDEEEVSETAEAETRTKEAALHSDELSKPDRKSKRGAPKDEIKKEDLPDKEGEDRPVARKSRRGKSSEAKSVNSDIPARKESPLKQTRSKSKDVIQKVETISARPGRNTRKSGKTEVKKENTDEPVNERKGRRVQQKPVKTHEIEIDSKQEIKSENITYTYKQCCGSANYQKENIVNISSSSRPTAKCLA